MNAAATFLSGVSMISFGASGVFFFKFWKASRDRFFLLFAIAFWLLSIERIALLMVVHADDSIRSVQSESSSWVFLIRLCAFTIILFAIIEKNRMAKGSGLSKKKP